MSTKVFIRIDDVSGQYLNRIARWFSENHPDVKCSLFAFHTQRDWDRRDWELAKELITNRGWEIGGHTRDHIQLDNISRDKIKRSIQNNLSDINEGLVSVGLDYDIESFAYPYGDYNQDVIEVLESLDIKNGLGYELSESFPQDGPPYGEGNYRWEVNNDDHGEHTDWNDEFLTASQNGNAYIFCIHPAWWNWSLYTDLYDVYKLDMNWKITTVELYRKFKKYLTRQDSPNNWDRLDEHLSFIKNHDVEFTTFKEATES